MCTAISYKANDFYFGRNLDLEYRFCEKVIITPRNYKFKFTKAKALKTHFAFIGIGVVADDFPLLYEGVNEKGLCVAGLSFAENAFYSHPICDKENLAPFEFIPFILSKCESVSQAEKLLKDINILDVDFNKDFKNTPLHWIISDSKKSITVEPMTDGLKVYNNPVGVLTNNPPFEIQLFNLNNFLSVTSGVPKNRFAKQLSLKPYSRGMGALGLPGDLSSMSRFVRACFTKLNSIKFETEEQNVNQFFHILESVFQTKGCVKVGEQFEFTVYSCCCNVSKGIFYYKTYFNTSICAVNMFNENLNSKKLISFEMKEETFIYSQN